MSDINVKLKNREEYPTDEVLKSVLGESFNAFKTLSDMLPVHEIATEWNYYNDGKAWLCKMPFKKKNLGWIVVYDNFFIITCYFTEKHIPKIVELQVSEKVKEDFFNAKPSGKLIPMSFTVKTKELPDDVLTMILFKKNIK